MSPFPLCRDQRKQAMVSSMFAKAFGKSRCTVKRSVTWSLVFLCIAVTCIYLACHKARQVRITRETSEVIEVGMSEAEVEKLIGGPPGDYLSEPVGFSHLDFVIEGVQREWRGDEG